MSTSTKDFYTKENLTDEQLERLENYFVVEMREYDGVPIIKDNVEAMFDWWLEDATDEEITNILNK